MDNKISFRANLVSNNIVRKPVVEGFQKATKVWKDSSFVLTRGTVEDGMQNNIIATMKSPRIMDDNSSVLVFKDFAPDMSDEAITTKLVRGFRMLMEEVSMNQKKYFVEKELKRANAVALEHAKKAEVTGEKGLTSISHAYETLALRCSKKVDVLNAKIAGIEEQASKNLNEIVGDDAELQALSSAILPVKKS